jgi:uncharacterized protein with GYD domain
VAGASAAQASDAAAADPARNPVLQRIWAATVAHRAASLTALAVEDPSMPTFIMLSTLTPEGVQTLKTNPTRIREVNQELEQLGATVKAQWATLGHYDFVNVVEAPDEKTMARVSLELGSRGTGRWETMVAIPIDDFIATL